MATPSRPPGRAIPQIYGDINNTDVNEIFRRLQEIASTIEGRRGPILFKDSAEIVTNLRKTLLKLQGMGDRATGSISFEGVTGSSMFLAKGAYQTDSGAWIATETSPVILELRGDTQSPRMYRNTDLEVGAEFTPNPVGWIAVGDEGGAAVAPGTTTELASPIQRVLPAPHTHLYPDVVGLEEAISVVASPIRPAPPSPHTHLYPDLIGVPEAISDITVSPLVAVKPHTHLVEDIPNRPVPEDVEWILAGQIFGG